MTMALTDFLLERIAGDDAAARRLLRYAQENELAVKEPQMLGRRLPGWHEWPDVQVMCSRVLVECEAKRRVVELADEATGLDMQVDSGFAVGPRTEPYIGDVMLRLLALPYAEHPDYRQEWRA